jgi:hypothetical protein
MISLLKKTAANELLAAVACKLFLEEELNLCLIELCFISRSTI